jgi:hypothetical protein
VETWENVMSSSPFSPLSTSNKILTPASELKPRKTMSNKLEDLASIIISLQIN